MTIIEAVAILLGVAGIFVAIVAVWSIQVNRNKILEQENDR